MKVSLSGLIQDDIQNSIGGIFENDYRRVLFEWNNATNEKERKIAVGKYIDIQHSELEYIDQWHDALSKNEIIK